jgi:hypothetical protein
MSITYEEISGRAYEKWKKEGQPSGKEQDHWIQAEAELREEQLKKQNGEKITSRDPSMLKTPKKGVL